MNVFRQTLILLFILFTFSYTLFSQRKKPNKGIGLTTSTINLTYLKHPQLYPHQIVQLQFLYLPQPNKMVTFSLGSFLGFDRSDQFRPLKPIWLSADYLHLHRYNKKKKTLLIYGAKLDMGIGEFTYASIPNGGAGELFYKRLHMGISPQIGVLIKSGKRNFFTTTLSTGVSSSFIKITEAPVGSYKYNAFAPISIRLGYNFMFKRKRR